MRGSSGSKPGGRRSLMSSPRLLTERSSQCHVVGPETPSRLANPVMLLRLIATVPGPSKEPATQTTARMLAPEARRDKDARLAALGLGRHRIGRRGAAGRGSLFGRGLGFGAGHGALLEPGPAFGGGLLRRRLPGRLGPEVLFHQAPFLHV